MNILNKDKIHQTVYYYGILLFTFSLPYYLLLSSYIIALLTLNWLIEGNFKQKFKNLKENPLAILFIGYYFLNIISYFYSVNKYEASFDLEKKLSFLILPLIITTSANFSSQQFHNILKTFVFSCLVAIILCLGIAYQRYTINPNPNYFFYYQLSESIDFHAVIFADYLIFAIVIVIYFWQKNSQSISLGYQISYLFLLFALLGFILLLSSKMVFILLFLLANLFFIFRYIQQKKFWLGLGIIVSFNLLLFIGIWSISFNRSRIENAFSSDMSYILKDKVSYDENNQLTGVSLRLMQWRFCLQILDEQQAWTFGMGIGDSQAHLNQKYIQANFYTGTSESDNNGYLDYNAHNQYVETFLKLGTIGLFYWLICLFYYLRYGIKTKNNLLLIFLFLGIIQCFSESFLEINKGVVFFVFFNCLFIRQDSSKGRS